MYTSQLMKERGQGDMTTLSQQVVISGETVDLRDRDIVTGSHIWPIKWLFPTVFILKVTPPIRNWFKRLGALLVPANTKHWANV